MTWASTFTGIPTIPPATGVWKISGGVVSWMVNVPGWVASLGTASRAVRVNW